MKSVEVILGGHASIPTHQQGGVLPYSKRAISEEAWGKSGLPPVLSSNEVTSCPYRGYYQRSSSRKPGLANQHNNLSSHLSAVRRRNLFFFIINQWQKVNKLIHLKHVLLGLVPTSKS